MEKDNDIYRNIFHELKSYLPVVLPTLLVYTIECRAHLKMWHAVRQLPHVEKEPSADDVESNSSLTPAETFDIRARRGAIKKQARTKLIFKLVLAILLLSIVLFENYVKLSGWLVRSKAGEEFDGYMGDPNDVDSEAETQSGSGYGWYYSSILGQINWTKSYYLLTLLMPSVLLLARALYILTGLKDRLVLRNTKGIPFVVFAKTTRFSPRRPRLIAASIILVSISLTIAALAYQSVICSMMIFASLIHFMISDLNVSSTVSTRQIFFTSVVMFIIVVTLYWQWMSAYTFPIRLLCWTRDASNLDWSGLIMSALVCSGQFNFIAMCYRMDHAFARPDERLVGSPDTAISELVTNDEGDAVQIDLHGTRISYCSHMRCPSSCSSCAKCPRFSRCLRWRKPYFRTSIHACLLVYVLIAYFKIKGYIEVDAEMAGVYSLYFFPPVACLGILLRAAVYGREELKRVWRYEEDWAGKDLLPVPGVALDGLVDDGQIEGKVILSGKETEKPLVEM